MQLLPKTFIVGKSFDIKELNKYMHGQDKQKKHEKPPKGS